MVSLGTFKLYLHKCKLKMKAVVDKYKRRLIFHMAVLPIFGKGLYERLSDRLDRQIAIRKRKWKSRLEILEGYPETNIYKELDKYMSGSSSLSQELSISNSKPINLLTLG